MAQHLSVKFNCQVFISYNVPSAYDTRQMEIEKAITEQLDILLEKR